MKCVFGDLSEAPLEDRHLFLQLFHLVHGEPLKRGGRLRHEGARVDGDAADPPFLAAFFHQQVEDVFDELDYGLDVLPLFTGSPP